MTNEDLKKLAEITITNIHNIRIISMVGGKELIAKEEIEIEHALQKVRDETIALCARQTNTDGFCICGDEIRALKEKKE